MGGNEEHNLIILNKHQDIENGVYKVSKGEES